MKERAIQLSINFSSEAVVKYTSNKRLNIDKESRRKKYRQKRKGDKNPVAKDMMKRSTVRRLTRMETIATITAAISMSKREIEALATE